MGAGKSDYTVLPFGPLDIQPYLASVAASMAELAATTAWAGAGLDVAGRLAWAQGRPAAWAARQEYSFTVRDAADGAFTGVCSLNRIDWVHCCGNLNFWTDSRRTGHGAASTAASAVKDFGLGQLGLARVEILTAHDNLAAQRVAVKAGAVREGILVDRLRIAGQQLNAVLFAATARTR